MILKAVMLSSCPSPKCVWVLEDFTQLKASIVKLALYRRSLAIQEKAHGRHHPDVALVLENLAKCSEEIGKSEEAKQYQARALQIRSKQNVPGTVVPIPDVATGGVESR